MKIHAAAALRAIGLVALFVFNFAGLPTNGLPTNGLPTNGLPTNGLPTNGLPTNGLPTNGLPTNCLNLEALENSLLFGNPDVHAALMGGPITAGRLTGPSSPLCAPWSDSYSPVLLSYTR